MVRFPFDTTNTYDENLNIDDNRKHRQNIYIYIGRNKDFNIYQYLSNFNKLIMIIMSIEERFFAKYLQSNRNLSNQEIRTGKRKLQKNLIVLKECEARDY